MILLRTFVLTKLLAAVLWLPVPVVNLQLMDCVLRLALYNKNLPLRYQLSGLLSKSRFNWGEPVASYSYPRCFQGLSLTIVKVKAKSTSDRIGSGLFLVSPCSKCESICC